MELQIIDILHLLLIIFTSIIGTLLVLVLLRVMKVLWMATEIVAFYEKIKQILSAYKQIPDLMKEKAKEYIKKEQ